MGLRRGFKSEANWFARSLRGELGLAPYSPLCPWKLARHLDFPVMALEDFVADIPHAIAHLRSAIGQGEFSAVTICKGTRRLIVYNDAHPRKRQAADVAHELSHGLLMHPPKPPFNEDGSRDYNPTLEEEANWLGPALLVSEEAALLIADRGLTISAASDRYGASEQVVRMRLNVTGAYRRVGRAA